MNTISRHQLDLLYQDFDVNKFLSVDPCGIVYELKEHTDNQLDIELGALFVAMITWGNRKAIRSAARHMLKDEMKWHPAEFVRSEAFRDSYRDAKNGCVYRTLNSDRFKEVCESIQQELGTANTLEELFSGKSIEECIETLARWLAPAKLGTAGKSACKRICMYLRWMIRQQSPDLGIWKSLSQKDLYAVMDVHVCQLTAPILKTKQANWKSCSELTRIFRGWCPEDPLKYDVALMVLADRITEEQRQP